MAKAWNQPVTEGVAQAKDYAEKLAIRFCYSANGRRGSTIPALHYRRKCRLRPFGIFDNPKQDRPEAPCPDLFTLAETPSAIIIYYRRPAGWPLRSDCREKHFPANAEWL